ncbi:hypothetical protein SAMN05421743_103299 [Thalassobacillus cyri]|uniref:Lipoprotein n=1 Tax=Thalassobacillus cyri TaxID=571932 RepID=A0A1H3ZP56_9BACI|nr:hypothetical protein [Thalassobacillus cyri]SEA25024.1 hypothetical protein SAMN05421743_103299 [Thalassobacillus cyri]
MKRLYWISTFIFLLLISAGCTKDIETPATIAKTPDSDYRNTFEGLNLGMLWDFEFYLPEADKRWVTLWVERYEEGEKESEPVTQLSYGMGPKEVEEGQLGLGIISPHLEEPSVFLYAPGSSQSPRKMTEGFKPEFPSAWGYAIGEEKVELKLGETMVLGGYRQSSTEGSIQVQDFQSKESIEEMIKEDHTMLLLKIKIEERTDAK